MSRCLPASLRVTARRCRLPHPQCRPRLNQCWKMRPRPCSVGKCREGIEAGGWRCFRSCHRRWKYCRSCCFLARPSLRCRHLQQEQGWQHGDVLQTEENLRTRSLGDLRSGPWPLRGHFRYTCLCSCLAALIERSKRARSDLPHRIFNQRQC